MNEREQQQNNQCLDIGVLVSLHDGELPAGERERALAHIATCAGCAADERAASASSRDVYDLLATSGPPEGEMPPTASAFAAMQARLDAEGLRENRHRTGALALLKPGSARPLRFIRSADCRHRPVHREDYFKHAKSSDAKHYHHHQPHYANRCPLARRLVLPDP
jgi:Putative zinc-finger